MAVQKTSGASSRAALGATVIAGILVAGFGGAALTALTADNAHQPGQSLVLVGQRDDYALRLADGAQDARAGVGQRDDYALRHADDK